MKKILLTTCALVAFSAVFYSCDKLKEKLFQSFITGELPGDFTAPIITNTSTLQDIGTVSIPYDINAEIKSQAGSGFSIDDIPGKITVNSITLTILNPDANNNFANFEMGGMKFNTNSNTTPITVGNDAIIPDVYATSRTFAVNNTIDIKSYLKNATTLGYFYNAKLRRPTTKPLNFHIVAKLKVGD